MGRIPLIKELNETRLASGYGGWIYCEKCNKTIGYLCYVTYDNFALDYKCKCGGSGSMRISFSESKKNREAVPGQELITIKNRLCCSKDNSPLFTLLKKNLESYRYEISCVKCGTNYIEEYYEQ